MLKSTQEGARLDEAREKKIAWKKWGPYLSERQWGTVREDYSDDGNAWSYFSHDQARSRAYKWGEDGIAGICDDKQSLCWALALWNGQDPIIKERLFGLTNAEGNHGEDVKEYYFYVDSTPEMRVIGVVTDRAEAMESLRRGEVLAVLEIPARMLQTVKTRHPVQTAVWVDSRNMVAANSLFTGLQKALGYAVEKLERVPQRWPG